MGIEKLRNLAIALAAFSLLLVSAHGAIAQEAEPRIALIIGNGAYGSVEALDNPVSDAELMAEVLAEQGFRVRVLTDTSQIALNRGIAQFGRDLREAGKDATGLFYYAGHAVQSFGTNYLLPTDASLTDAADLSLVAVPAQAVLRQMYSAQNKTNIVILDACRNNPFETIPGLNDNGLAEMKAPTGTFLSYSTAPGAVALDGLEGNSPFTTALARQIPNAGVPIEQIFKSVRVEVIEATEGLQTPWDTSSLTNDFVFKAKESLSEDEVAELNLWESIKDSTDPVPVVLFIKSYPDSKYLAEAQALLTNILVPQVTSQAAPTETAEAAPPEPVDTTEDQQRLIGVAQGSGTAEDYLAYLAAYPDGIYAEFAAFELKILEEKAERAAAAKAEEDEIVVAAAPARAAPPTISEDISFTSALLSNVEEINGKSIIEIVDLSPLFPPIEGIPDELWKGQSCSNCHQWTQEAMCTQGSTYIAATADEVTAKPHPFGGEFKLNLRAWAEGGCK